MSPSYRVFAVLTFRDLARKISTSITVGRREQ
jgi:hypothetical protein